MKTTVALCVLLSTACASTTTQEFRGAAGECVTTSDDAVDDYTALLVLTRTPGEPSEALFGIGFIGFVDMWMTAAADKVDEGPSGIEVRGSFKNGDSTPDQFELALEESDNGLTGTMEFVDAATLVLCDEVSLELVR